MSSFPVGAVTVGGERLEVWVADESRERQQGLRGVEELPGTIDGMLFAYAAPAATSFNMRGAPIPLDIWWFAADMSLIGTAEMEPCLEQLCTSYGSPGEVQWVLETPLGEYEFERGALLSIVETN